MQSEATTLYFFAIRTGQLKSFHGNSPLVAIDIWRWSYTPRVTSQPSNKDSTKTQRTRSQNKNFARAPQQIDKDTSLGWHSEPFGKIAGRVLLGSYVLKHTLTQNSKRFVAGQRLDLRHNPGDMTSSKGIDRRNLGNNCPTYHFAWGKKHSKTAKRFENAVGRLEHSDPERR